MMKRRQGRPGIIRRRITVWAAAVLTAVLAAGCLAPCVPAAAGGAPETAAKTAAENADAAEGFEEKEFPAVYSDGPDGTVTLRFYEDLPEIAYISAAEYLRIMMPGAQMETHREDDGTYTLTSPTGEASADTENDTLSSDDLAAFTNVMGQLQEGMGNTYLDGLPFIRYRDMEIEPAEVPVTIDLGAYGFDIRGGEDGVYFPFAVLNDLYSDLFYHVGFFNGETVVINNVNETFLPDMILPEYSRPVITKKERSAAEAEFVYHELCFVTDHLYGYPGRNALEAEGLEENGLDATLSEMGPLGEDVKKLLLSTDPVEYLAGMNILSDLMADGGHTFLSHLGLHMNSFYRYAPQTIGRAVDLYSDYLEEYPELMDLVLAGQEENEAGSAVRAARRSMLGSSGTYFKYGDTALLVFRSFNPEKNGAWKRYYDGTGLFPSSKNDPDDMMAVFLEGLKKADEDPNVRNLIIDLTDNGGGSVDIVMTIMSLITGESSLYMQNAMTGQMIRTYYDVDRNFDRVFDEQDAEVEYDLHFAVLTSSYSFSCANLLPAMMKDAGYPVIGEQSGGGTCALQIMQTEEGWPYILSSFRSRLCNAAGEMIDGGVPVDVELTGDGERPDYTNFFDLRKLDELMDELFAEGEQQEGPEEEPAELEPAA